MTWFLIGTIVLLALAPLWHFAPSKRQRQQASLREAAALSGLFVEFRDLPLPEARRSRLAAAERQVLYYGCRLRPTSKAPLKRLTWYRDADAWTCLQGRQPPPAAVMAMPEVILAAEAGRATCGVYWREEGDVEMVEKLASHLASWRNELTPAREDAP